MCSSSHYFPVQHKYELEINLSLSLIHPHMLIIENENEFNLEKKKSALLPMTSYGWRGVGGATHALLKNSWAVRFQKKLESTPILTPGSGNR